MRKAGKVRGGKKQAQHVDMYRKVLLRKRLLSYVKPGVAYIPFIGDGDIATELYKNFQIYGADIDPQRVAVAQDRLPEANIITADCDGWPFSEIDTAFSLADFDAYVEPYAAFRAFWKNASKAGPLVLFFTDGNKHNLYFSSWWLQPDGTREELENLIEMRRVYNFYFPRHIKPWFIEYIKPWKAAKFSFYLRRNMLYWGAVVTNA